MHAQTLPARARKRVWCSERLFSLVKWGRVAPRLESSNQIAERLIICDDVGNQARDLALQTEGKLLSELICYVLGRSKVGRSLLEFCKPCLAQ